MSATATKLLTADDLWRMPGHGKSHELVKGELRDMPPSGFEHGDVTINITLPIGSFVKEHDLGKCVAAETGFVLAKGPDTVRGADLAFVRKGRLPKDRVIGEFFPGAPDLAVEVLSPSDRLGEVEEKIEEWLSGGARAVWLVHPRQKTVTIYRKSEEPLTLTSKDTLDGGDILPGFKLKVKELFG